MTLEEIARKGRRSTSEPTTIPEVQRWLHHHGYPECTEDNAWRVLFVRRLVREGRVHEEKS